MANMKKGCIRKSRKMFKLVCGETWKITKKFEGDRYEKGDTFKILHDTAYTEIVGIEHYDLSASTTTQLKLITDRNGDPIHPDWFFIRKAKIFYIHCVYETNHEMILRFRLKNKSKLRFEYYADEIPVPAPSSHGRGGGGN